MATARTIHRLHGADPPGLADARTWIGDRATDANGTGIGRIEDVWVDAQSGDPAWLLIREGRFGGGNHRLVPFDGATGGGGQVWLPHDKETVRTAPDIGSDGLLTAALGERLLEHYAAAGSDRAPSTGGW